MESQIEKALQKMSIMGYTVYPMRGFYMVDGRANGVKMVKEKTGEILISPQFDKVQRLGNNKFVVYKSDRFGIFDTETWSESTYYQGLELREVYGGKFYLVYRLDGMYGVIDDSDNEIVAHNYTFINFTNMGEMPPLIVGTKISNADYDGYETYDDLYNISGEYLQVNKRIKGKPYFIMGDKVYVDEDGVVKIYNLKGEMIRNGGKG